MKIKINFMHLVVFFYAILILLLIAAIVNLQILINNFDISEHIKLVFGKLFNRPELNKYENKTIEFAIVLINREGIVKSGSIIKSLTGLQLDDEHIGKYIFVVNETLIVYDYRRDKILHISESEVYKQLHLSATAR